VIRLAQPEYLALLAVVALMTAAAAWLARWRERARREFAGPQAARWQGSGFWLSTSPLLLAAALLVIAAARPQWGSRELLRERQGVDLVIVLDISQSMEAADVQPNRLAVAQEELVRLVEQQRGSRIGLVFFAGSAIMRSPLTTDTQAVTQLIRRADEEGGLVRAGSDIGAALAQAAEVLANSDNPGKAVLLVSDGEDHGGAFVQQAQALREKGIVVLTAGVGTAAGGQLFDVDARGQRVPKLDAARQPIVSRLNESVLRSIAATGGGAYHSLSEGRSGGLGGIGVELSRLDPSPTGDDALKLPVERFQVFLAAAAALLVASWFVPVRLALPILAWLRRARPHGALPLLLLTLVLVACGSGDSIREENARANRLYAQGDFRAALAEYQKLLAERPDLDALSYNAGNALHRLGEFERAAAETQRALPPRGPALGAATYYALGNHFLQLQRLEDAYFAYRRALLLDPADADAKHNLELTLLLLNRQQQPAAGGSGSDQPGPPGGEGTPGQKQQPGASPEGTTPQPGEAENGPAAQPTPGVPAAALQRQLEEALAGIDEELTFEEAIRILDLLREQQRQRQAPQGPRPSGPDY